MNTVAEWRHRRTVPGTDKAKSSVQVPIVGGDRVLGGILVENHEREYAFGESELRLLTTVAASMGVALENARLFDETQRLLKETEQRNAELAVINSIQQGMAGSLDFQGIVDLVGDKLRAELDNPTSASAGSTPPPTRSLRVTFEHGRRLPIGRRRRARPARRRGNMIETRQPHVFNTIAEQFAAGIGTVPGTDQALSMIYVPIIGRDRVIGLIGIENHEREHAFGEADVRLLQTVATSMGVALESARLFDETQRLLKETDARAAELSIINSVQQGLANKLDARSIYELVGEKLRELFDSQGISIATFDTEPPSGTTPS